MTVIAGRIGPSAVSVYQILLNLLATMFMGALGLASAAAVLTAEAAGRRDPVDATRAGFVSLALGGLFALAAGLLVVSFAPQVGRAYTADASLAAQVAASLWLTPLVMWGANAVNLALNLALVPEFGAAGSAWATFGARVGLAAGLALWVFRRDDAAELGIRGPMLGPGYRSLLGVGVAACVSQAAEAGAESGGPLLPAANKSRSAAILTARRSCATGQRTEKSIFRAVSSSSRPTRRRAKQSV